MIRITLLVATALAGLAAGFFVTYSISVVRGLAVVDDETFVAAFQGINAEVRNGWFAVFFFGTPVATAAAALLLVAHRSWPAAVLVGIGLLSYAVGVLGVTFGLHVPLNERLAALGPLTGEAATAARTAYENVWNRWNHLRAVAALGAFLLLLGALDRVRGS